MANRSKRGRKRKATWSLWTERRVPSEYEVVSHKLNHTFGNHPAPFHLDKNAPMNQWYLKYREGSQFQVDDWEAFRDPKRLTYRDYVTLQNEKELYLGNLIDDFEKDEEHYTKLSEGWINTLEYLYIPYRFSGHILQIVALYMAQIAPSAYISNVGYFQGGDELRRLQHNSYFAKVLSLELNRPKLADTESTRTIWEKDAHWQPMRELLEKLMIAYDWGESFAALNLVVKPLYDALYNIQFAQLAYKNGDELLNLMHNNFNLDTDRFKNWTKELVKYSVERRSENQDLLKNWIEDWRGLAYHAIDGLAPLFEQAPHQMSAKDVTKAVRKSHHDFLVDMGLEQ